MCVSLDARGTASAAVSELKSPKVASVCDGVLTDRRTVFGEPSFSTVAGDNDALLFAWDIRGDIDLLVEGDFELVRSMSALEGALAVAKIDGSASLEGDWNELRSLIVQSCMFPLTLPGALKISFSASFPADLPIVDADSLTARKCEGASRVTGSGLRSLSCTCKDCKMEVEVGGGSTRPPMDVRGEEAAVTGTMTECVDRAASG